MEYLHSKKIFHGYSNILVKARNMSTEGYLHAKVSLFGLSSSISLTSKIASGQNGTHPFIWYAPEVLAKQELLGNQANLKQLEKSDVYSFGMICFQLLTGKIPFEDSHLQGDKMSQNIRAGERPLFPFYSPKYVTSLTKKCWHADPNQRPSFSSVCRILRYIKRFLLLNPDHSQPDPPMTMVDYWDIKMGVLKNLPYWGYSNVFPPSQIPFQMFAYRVMEKERHNASQRESYESGSDGTVSKISTRFIKNTRNKHWIILSIKTQKILQEGSRIEYDFPKANLPPVPSVCTSKMPPRTPPITPSARYVLSVL